jgi:Zn-dependent peptidase ImmA (M78 family)/DNA-binding XRE family transcriptional regulator
MKRTPGYVGENLKRARIARKMTATSLAEQLSLTRSAISSYETGSKSPSPEIAEKICEILNFPMSFFLKGKKIDLDFETLSFYRSRNAATKSARDMADEKFQWLLSLIFLLETFVEFPPLNFPSIECPTDPDKISNEFIEDVATKVRRFWNLRDGPISNAVWLLENNGVVIIRRELESAHLDAFSNWVNERPYIVLGNEKQCAVRSRFDLGHELGHLILHRNIPKNVRENPDYFELIENQANRFAGAFHFPEISFAQEVSTPSLEKFRLLKKRWKLSIGMMIFRAKDLNFISPEQSQLFWRNYARRGWRQSEPYDEVIELEVPTLILEAIKIAINDEIITSSEIHYELGLYFSDIEDCAGLPSNFFHSNTSKVVQLTPRLKSDSEPKQYNQPAEVLTLDFSR